MIGRAMESEGTNAAAMARDGIERVSAGFDNAISHLGLDASAGAAQLADVHIGYWFALAIALAVAGLIHGMVLRGRIKRMEHDVRHNPDVRVGEAIRALQEESQSLAREVKALEYHLSAQRRSTGQDILARGAQRPGSRNNAAHARNAGS